MVAGVVKLSNRRNEITSLRDDNKLLQGIAGKSIGEIEGLAVEEFELTSETGPAIQRIA